MRSILHQLAKYSLPPEKAKEEPKTPEGTVSNTITPEELARAIIDPDKIDYLLEGTIKRLKGMGHFEWSDVLYPLEMIAIYHLYHNHQWQVANEVRTDNFLKEFMAKRSMDQFRVDYEKAVDDTSKDIAMARVLMASLDKVGDNKSTITVYNQVYSTSYTDGRVSQDKLPTSPYSKTASEYLGIGADYHTASALLDKLHRNSSAEQILLGRMGYLMVWYWNQKNFSTAQSDPKSLPLLS